MKGPLILLMLVVVAGCDGTGLYLGDTEVAFARWKAANLHDYEIQQRIVFICNRCDGSSAERFARVVVRNGEVVEVHDAEGAFVIVSEIMPTPPEDHALTVDEVFTRILAAEGRATGRVEVAFSSKFNYPLQFYMESEDGEVREAILLRNLKPL